MNRKRRFKVDKLIRDKIPELLRAESVTAFERTLCKDEYIERLKDKILEEAKEVIEAKNSGQIKEELADIPGRLHYN